MVFPLITSTTHPTLFNIGRELNYSIAFERLIYRVSAGRIGKHRAEVVEKERGQVPGVVAFIANVAIGHAATKIATIGGPVRQAW